MTIKEDVGKQNLKYPIDILNEDILKLVKKHKIITKRTMKEKEWGSTINFYLYSCRFLLIIFEKGTKEELQHGSRNNKRSIVSNDATFI